MGESWKPTDAICSWRSRPRASAAPRWRPWPHREPAGDLCQAGQHRQRAAAGEQRGFRDQSHARARARNGEPRRRTIEGSSMAARTWTTEQRQRQREAIRRWKPWNQSTGPASPKEGGGGAVNARGGQRAEMRKAEIKELREALQAQRDMLEDMSRGAGETLGLRLRRHPAVPHAQKKALFENNQMIGRGWVWGAYRRGEPCKNDGTFINQKHESKHPCVFRDGLY